MKFDKEHWKEVDVNVDSLWIIGPRAKGGKHSNEYHGNFAPQVPNHLIRRYTDEGGVVVDMFTGSGTALFECESLKRHYIGFDINQEILDVVESKMQDCNSIEYYLHNCNVLDQRMVQSLMDVDMKGLGKKKADLILSHPPYMDIVKFTDQPCDLSRINDTNQFIDTYIRSVRNIFPYLKKGKYFALIIGDLYRDSEVIPLGFYLMDAIKRNFPVKLKGIVVKDMVGNRGKQGASALWHYKALKSDFFIFKHEYIFVFKKEG